MTIRISFHFGMKSLRNIAHSLADLSSMMTDCEGFNYFRNMLRDYASPMTAPYKETLKKYDGKENIGIFIRDSTSYPSRGTMVNLLRLFSQRATLGDHERRFEVRLYCPRAFLQEYRKFEGEDALLTEQHQKLADDYKNFISFWDEVFKKSLRNQQLKELF